MSDALAAVPLTTLAAASATQIGKTTFGGMSVSGSDTLVMYTYAGDANLSGSITGDDYFRIDTGYASRNNATPLSGYFNGDFDYSGKIDADDYFLIDRNYAHQGAAFSPAPLPGEVTAVPEAGGLGVIAAGLLLARRRRGRGAAR